MQNNDYLIWKNGFKSKTLLTMMIIPSYGGQNKKTRQFLLPGHLPGTYLPFKRSQRLLTAALLVINYYTSMIYQRQVLQEGQCFQAISLQFKSWLWKNTNTAPVIIFSGGAKWQGKKDIPMTLGYSFAEQFYA
ncbi:MAG: hypothetical protein AAB681_00460 [Patescibacteria group bacterium]